MNEDEDDIDGEGGIHRAGVNGWKSTVEFLRRKGDLLYQSRPAISTEGNNDHHPPRLPDQQSETLYDIG